MQCFALFTPVSTVHILQRRNSVILRPTEFFPSDRSRTSATVPNPWRCLNRVSYMRASPSSSSSSPSPSPSQSPSSSYTSVATDMPHSVEVSTGAGVQHLGSSVGLGMNVEHAALPHVRLRWVPNLSMSQRLQRTAAAVAVLFLIAVALLLLRAAAAPAWRPLFSLHDRLLCLALAVIAPELGLVAYDNFRSCAIVARRAERRQSRTFEALALPVRLHGVLTAAISAAQLAGLYTSAIVSPAPGALITLFITSLFFCIRRVRFERVGRVYRVSPSEYLDVIIACGACFFLVLAMHMGLYRLGLSALAVIVSLLYWVCKVIFVPG